MRQFGVLGGGNARVTGAAEDRFAIAALDALSMRAGVRLNRGGGASAENGGAQELRNRSLLFIAEECLRVTGQSVPDDPDGIASEAIRGDGAPITVRASSGDSSFARPADFPNLMSSLMGRMLDQAAEYSQPTCREWASQIDSVPDFRPKTLIATGEFGEFPLVRDGEDFDQSTVAEEGSWFAVDSYGDEWQLTPRMVTDDDLGALTDVSEGKQDAHDQTLNRLCVDLLTGNPTLTDGVALFHSSHGNLRTGGAAPGQTELSAMRLLLRKQKGVSQKRKLNLTLKGLLIPEDLETTTQQLLSPAVTVVAAQTTNGELFRGQVQYWVEPMLADDSTVKYYGFADPRRARAIVYCYQRGFEKMKARNYFNPKNNCRVFQFEGRFAAAVRNWRGVVRNDGQ